MTPSKQAPAGQSALFEPIPRHPAAAENFATGAVLLRQFAGLIAAELIAAVEEVANRSPFRKMQTRWGPMSVAMTNCGAVGWVSDQTGYRYDPIDPDSGNPWPAMPQIFLDLAVRAAAEAGYRSFAPDACLINRYEPGTRMGLHQDRDETDFAQPIVSVSLGLPATFLWGGENRKERPVRMRLESGDVVVWGGPTRLHFHGVAPLAEGSHPLTGPSRINLTFRKAR